jgi:hypothetical protein
LAVALLLLPLGTAVASWSQAAAVPTFSITGVVPDQSVTIQTASFPANVVFNVTMGPMGTQGINGTAVGTYNSGAGGSGTATFNIPANLKGAPQISIRLQGSGGYFAYNWFNNVSSGPSGGATPGGSSAIPTFTIQSVVANQSVTIRTTNFPANHSFTATMGPFGSQGVGGTAVGTTNSGAGGSFTATYNIPASLQGTNRIAIRLQSAQGYFAYNWFYNSTAGSPVATGTPPTATPVTPTATAPAVTPTATAPAATPQSANPSFSITTVQRDQSVTIQTRNFPANQSFTVTMGPFGGLGVGGTVVGTTNSGAGGSFTATYNIPANLAGSHRIAIRLQSSQGYFAYNWFYNNNAP